MQAVFFLGAATLSALPVLLPFVPTILTGLTTKPPWNVGHGWRDYAAADRTGCAHQMAGFGVFMRPRSDRVSDTWSILPLDFLQGLRRSTHGRPITGLEN
jgi:hypothetical protein